MQTMHSFEKKCYHNSKLLPKYKNAYVKWTKYSFVLLDFIGEEFKGLTKHI